jgi:hypothetical protein
MDVDARHAAEMDTLSNKHAEQMMVSDRPGRPGTSMPDTCGRDAGHPSSNKHAQQRMVFTDQRPGRRSDADQWQQTVR